MCAIELAIVDKYNNNNSNSNINKVAWSKRAMNMNFMCKKTFSCSD